MSIHIKEDRLVVISDWHLGNPFCSVKHDIVRFLDYVHANKFSLCINGDGLDISQTSFSRLARDVPEIFSRIRKILNDGGNVYYTIGNHDIVLEHFFEDWGPFHLVPFLNLRSGNKRIRIEHGHLYDPFFVKSPGLYSIATAAAGVVLGIVPSVFKAWIAWENFVYTRSGKNSAIARAERGENRAFLEAVLELQSRAFDVVIFGHTHHASMLEFGNGQQYVNTGSWLVVPAFAEIDHGEVVLRRWPEGQIEAKKHLTLETEPAEADMPATQ